MITEVIGSVQGCKATELPVLLREFLNDPQCSQIYQFEIPDLIQEMVQEGMLVEVEYILPNMNYRIKSFLLPANTEIKRKC